MLSNYLAEVWGIFLVAVPLSLLLNQNYLKKLFESTEDDKNMFCLGVIDLVIGVAMVLSHNIWVKNWQVIITIFAWISLLKGLTILFSPKIIKDLLKKIENAPILPFILVLAVFLGLALTYLGFTA